MVELIFTVENSVNSDAMCGFQMNFRMVVIAERVQGIRCLQQDDVHQDSSATRCTSSRMETAPLVVSTSLVTFLLVMVRFIDGYDSP
jgi:hypothetical protein